MARLIPLTQGQHAIVDDEDFERLGAHKWQASYCKNTGNYYARRRELIDDKSCTIYMHREVLQAKRGNKVDHRKVTRTLDNRKQNLRPATSSQNSANGRIRKSNTSGFKGVHWHRKCEKWQARVTVQGKAHSQGLFADKVEAAKARDIAARKLHGEFAHLNFPEAING